MAEADTRRADLIDNDWPGLPQYLASALAACASAGGPFAGSGISPSLDPARDSTSSLESRSRSESAPASGTESRSDLRKWVNRIRENPVSFGDVLVDVQDAMVRAVLLHVARYALTEDMKRVARLVARGLAYADCAGTGDEVADGEAENGIDEEEDDADGEGDEESEFVYGVPLSLVLARAKVYEALGYAELALADAYVVYTMADAEVGDGETDLVPVDVDGKPIRQVGSSESDSAKVTEAEHLGLDWWKVLYDALLVMTRAMVVLGCFADAKSFIERLVLAKAGMTSDDFETSGCEDPVQASGQIEDQSKQAIRDDLVKGGSRDFNGRFAAVVEGILFERHNVAMPMFGWSQRLVYPWSEHEPNRMEVDSLAEINEHLSVAAPKLEVRKSILPSLTQGSATTHDALREEQEVSAQLGLYAKENLTKGQIILEERSALTAIRPHGAALCDACAADLETIAKEQQRHCVGCDRPYCSEACHEAAKTKYHAQNTNDEENEEGYPPAETPFCPGPSGIDDLHTLGRAESSITPEWDLYFLLLSRSLQMAVTQDMHPLDLFEIKYLWGDFSPTPELIKTTVQETPKTLPYSFRHHVELPAQWFEVLMHSRRNCQPYSEEWLERYDWWIIQTLFAKFRGVADAQQSTWTGKPEVAAVHPLWCLANHSCDPNVTWKPLGVRNLTVVEERLSDKDVGSAPWNGIKEGEEIWNHYTDVSEKDFRERRARLKAVLGGDCMCERCMREARRAEVAKE